MRPARQGDDVTEKDERAEEEVQPEPVKPGTRTPLPKEIGGVKGPEPTRYGDWEHKGRCTDF
jgi:hypothetical protein